MVDFCTNSTIALESYAQCSYINTPPQSGVDTSNETLFEIVSTPLTPCNNFFRWVYRPSIGSYRRINAKIDHFLKFQNLKGPMLREKNIVEAIKNMVSLRF